MKADAAARASAALAVRRRARRLYSTAEVMRAIHRMAAEATSRLRHANPVVLAVMHGGAFAAVEMCKRFDFPHEFDYVHVTRYGGGVAPRELAWRVRPSAQLKGRTVLVVDDILDRGHTLRALKQELTRVGVAKQYAAALVVKRVAKAGRRPKVDFAGLPVDDVYVFGCGMDYFGYWRELRALYAIDGSTEHE
ncbi:MAG: hypoxanthine-guanine phosphoribosyltransferase [Gammaproteobacteria bacterium]